MKAKSAAAAVILILLILLSGCTNTDNTSELPGDSTITESTEINEENASEIENGSESETNLNIEDEVQPVRNQLVNNYSSVSPFTGLPLEDEYYSRAVAVSVENSPAARPQSGLDKAQIVYEFMTEGGITRFLAIYWPEVPEKIGPIRSARPFLIETAAAYDSLFLHAGASPDGFQMLSEENILNLDQIYQSSYFWRSSKRNAPHNLYSGKPALSSYLSDITKREYPEQFDFITASVLSGFDRAEEIEIKYWGDYSVFYRYDKLNNTYLRYLNSLDNPHEGENGTHLEAKNVIIQFVETEIKDEIGRLDINLNSEGEIILFRDGAAVKGSWEKNGRYDINFYNQNGDRLKINPGQTWIQVVPNNTEIIY